MGLVGAFLCAPRVRSQSANGGSTGKTRTYYIAADEVNWDYAPSGYDVAMGHPFDALEKLYTEPGPHRIGGVYKKAIYREYTNGTFTKLKPRPADQQYLGLVGPILRGEVGGHDPRGFQEPRFASLQHPPAWCTLRKGFRGRRLQ